MATATIVKEYTFTWEGTDKKGGKIKGLTKSRSEALVKAQLRKQGINPTRVRKQSTLFSGAKKKKITAGDIAIFSRQMATMMSAGVPLVQALDIIGKGHENPSMQTLVGTIKADVESGNALFEALAKHPLQFD